VEAEHGEHEDFCRTKLKHPGFTLVLSIRNVRGRRHPVVKKTHATRKQAASSLLDAFLAFQSPCVCAELRFLLAEMRESIRILQDDVRALQERLENPPVGTYLPFYFILFIYNVSKRVLHSGANGQKQRTSDL